MYSYNIDLMDAYILDESYFLIIYTKDKVGIMFLNEIKEKF